MKISSLEDLWEVIEDAAGRQRLDTYALAKKAGLPWQTIFNARGASPSLITVLRLLHALGLTLSLRKSAKPSPRALVRPVSAGRLLLAAPDTPPP